MTNTVPTIDDVRAAAARIEPFVHRTPEFQSATIDRRVGAKVFCKAENLQKVGAFKARGATNAIVSLSEADRKRGIATHSSGNHGQAVAYAASIVGVPATIVMPRHAPAVKVEAVRGYGAEIVFCAQDERESTLAKIVEASGASVVHPFDDPDVVAGQGTAALELCEQVPDLDLLITPIGGGGLLSGTTLVASDLGIAAIGAEPEVVDDAYRSLRDGTRYGPTGEISVGDGLLTGIGSIAFRILSEARTEIITVSEDEILAAMRYVTERTKYLVEPSAATVFAAMFTRSQRFEGARVGAIVSGGNVELSRLSADS